MLTSLLKALSASEPEPLSPEDCRLAVAALMVRLARADDHYTGVEKTMILSVLMDRYGVDEGAAEALRAEAEELETQSPDTVRFTKVVKSCVPYEERSNVVKSLWRVALADGTRNFEEDGFLRLVVNLLGVNDRDSGLARQAVIADLAKG